MAMAKRLRTIWPALIALAVASGYCIWRLWSVGWDPVGLAEIGSRFAEGDPAGSEGYDGQFVYYVALNPNPAEVRVYLDDPAYRYQRIVYPILARVIAAGNEARIPWALLGINLVALAVGTWSVGKFLVDHGLASGYALIYGLWVGLVASVGLYLHEPLAFMFIAFGWLARGQRKHLLSAVCLGLAIFTKETTLLFFVAALIADLTDRQKSNSLVAMFACGVLFIGWQLWLSHVFGEPGIGIRGMGATSFELIPFMGLWRIGFISLPVMVLYALAFGPTIVFPAVWGSITSARAICLDHRRAEAWALLLTSLAIVFLPFSSFREPLGLMRSSLGMVLSVVLFSTQVGLKKPLNYGLFWIPLLAFLLNG
jgi:hypothetical protein